MDPTDCPKCQTPLPPRLSSGRLVCSNCGWTDRPKKVEEPQPEAIANREDVQNIVPAEPKPRFWNVDISPRSTRNFGWLLFVVGSLMMLRGLLYDPTVSSEDSFGLEKRTYNIGAINIKQTWTNTGGFIAVCGAAFASGSNIGKNQ